MTTTPPDNNTTARAVERPDDTSVAELVSDAAAKLSTLMRQEIELAKAETKQQAARASVGSLMLSAAGVLGLLVLLLASLAATRWLSGAMDLGWAYLVVAGFWLLVAVVLALVGRSQLKRVSIRPEQTAQTLSELPTALKGR